MYAPEAAPNSPPAFWSPEQQHVQLSWPKACAGCQVGLSLKLDHVFEAATIGPQNQQQQQQQQQQHQQHQQISSRSAAASAAAAAASVAAAAAAAATASVADQQQKYSYSVVQQLIDRKTRKNREVHALQRS